MLLSALLKSNWRWILKGVTSRVKLLNQSHIKQSRRCTQVQLPYQNAEHHVPTRPHCYCMHRWRYLTLGLDWRIYDFLSDRPQPQTEKQSCKYNHNDEGKKTSCCCAVVGFHVVAEETCVGEEVGGMEESVEVGPDWRHMFVTEYIWK